MESTTESLVTNLTTNSSLDNFSRDESLARVEILLQIIIFVLAVSGNTTVLLSLLLRRKKLTRMHLLMIHLSLADLFVAFGSVLPQIAWDVTFVFKGGDFLCRLVKYMQVVAIYASSYVLVMTAIDRYVAICFPFISRKWSSKMVHKLVVVAWALSLLFSIPQTFIFSYKTTPYGQTDCWASFEPVWTLTLYITIFTVLVYILPTVILTFCYGNICLEVWRSSRSGLSSVPVGSKTASHVEYTNNAGTIDTIAPDATTQNTSSNTSEFKRDTNGLCGVQTSQNTRCKIQDVCQTGDTKYQCERTPTSAKNKTQDLKGNVFKFKTFRARWSSAASTTRTSTDQRHAPVGLTRAKIKTVKMTLTVVLCYFLCWSPFFIAQMWAAWDESAPFNGAPYTIILLLASLNSCTNPWIYLVFSDSVCFEVKQCVYKFCRCQQKLEYNGD